MKKKTVTRTLFDGLNYDALAHLLSYLAPTEAWALAKTNQSLHQRITQARYWRDQGQLYFPFLRNWYLLVPPKDVTVFKLFTLAYQQQIKSKTAEQRRLIDVIARNQLEYSSENLKLLRKHFPLKEERHLSGLCRYHLWQWFMESQCSWQKSKTFWSLTRKYHSTTKYRVLIAEGKIDEFFKQINDYEYDLIETFSYRKSSTAKYFLPQLLGLLRLGYTSYLNQIIDFAEKYYFLDELMFSCLEKCPHLSPLEYCIQYQDYDAFVLCYNTMWDIEAYDILRPNTLLLMLQCDDPRFLDYIFSNTVQHDSLKALMESILSYQAKVESLIAEDTLSPIKSDGELAMVYKIINEHAYRQSLNPFIRRGLFFGGLQQQLYNIFAVSISLCYQHGDEKTAKLLLEKILAKSSQIAPEVKQKTYMFDENLKKSEMDEFFSTVLTLDQDQVYKTVMAMQPTKEQKQFVRDAWEELGGPEQAEGYWYFFWGVVLLVTAALLMCALAAFLMSPSAMLLVNQLIEPIVVPLINQLTLSIIVSVITASLAVISAGVGVYLLKKSDALYNTSMDELPCESNKVRMTAKTEPPPPKPFHDIKEGIRGWDKSKKCNINNSDWRAKVNFPLFFSGKSSDGKADCRSCHTPTLRFSERMNFNYIV